MISMALQGSTNVSILGSVFINVFDMQPWGAYVVWVVAYAIFIMVNFNEKRFFQINLWMNLYCCALLVIFIVGMLINLPFHGNISGIAIDGMTQYSRFPTASDIIITLPYAIWFFVGMEVRQ
jgi:hypothetical protein